MATRKRALSPAEYRAKTRALRTFANGFSASEGYDLRKPLSSAKKAKINRYFEEYERLTSRPHYKYTPRKKSRLETAQKFSQHDPGFKGVRSAYIITDGEEVPEIRFTKDESKMYFKFGPMKVAPLFIDPMALATDIKSAVETVTEGFPENTLYTVMAGAFEIYGQFNSASSIVGKIEQLQSMYSDPFKNNYWENWLTGIKAYETDDTVDIADYIQIQSKRREEIKKLKRRQQRERKKTREAYHARRK